MKRKIAVVTSSRADYSHLYWPLRDLSAHLQVDLKLIVLGPHLSPEFGHTLREIEKASLYARPSPDKKTGFPIKLESPVLWPQEKRKSSFHAILLSNPKIPR